MSSRTALRPVHLRELGAALMQGIPIDLSDEDAVHALNHRDELHRNLARILRSSTLCGIVEGRGSILVDYDMSVEEMIGRGKYDRVDADINSQNFPSTRRGTDNVRVVLVHFGRDTISEPINRGMILEPKTEEVLFQLDKRNLRAAELPELLAVHAAYPELRGGMPLVALGSVWQNPVNQLVPGIWGDTTSSLELAPIARKWSEGDRFLAVHK